MAFNDIEFIAILFFFACIFFAGLRRRSESLDGRFTGIDLSMSSALKGIACVFILMGHYVSHREGVVEITTFSRIIQYTTANIALAIFMYFSGYGLSLKTVKRGGHLSVWFKRMKKVYIPLFLTCVVAMVVYLILPDRFSLTELESMGVSKDIWYIHHFNNEYLSTLIPHTLGWKDWYVFCIMIFYSLFYISSNLTKDHPLNQTWVLWLMLLVYYVCAYLFFGPPEAHWYRYCWSFFLGHVHAKMVQSNEINKWDMAMLAVLLATILIEPNFLKLSYFVAVAIIIICAWINKRYVINSRILAFMAGISYFFYLSHERIGYLLISYINCYSVIAWVTLSILISMVLKKMHS